MSAFAVPVRRKAVVSGLGRLGWQVMMRGRGGSTPAFLLHSRTVFSSAVLLQHQPGGFTHVHRSSLAKLTPQQATNVLRANDASFVMDFDSPVHRFDSNQLASNSPIEDRRAAGRCLYSGDMLFGVFDGHGGSACAQTVSERLLDYIAVSLMDYKQLCDYKSSMESSTGRADAVRRFNFANDYSSQEGSRRYTDALYKFAREVLAAYDEEAEAADCLRHAFERLDEDISSEAQTKLPNGQVNFEALQAAYAGATTVVAYVHGADLYIANVGDSGAVIGVHNEDGTWEPRPLSSDHNALNPSEILRIRSEHPRSESTFVVKGGRLLGYLQPLRAFGDVKFKWNKRLQKEVLNTAYNKNLIPVNYYTPPYLTAMPEITHHRLTSNDKFLILASDGLWEPMMKHTAVRLVAEHLMGNHKGRLHFDDGIKTLGDISNILKKRRASHSAEVMDQNVTTHLIRHALGGTDDGIDHSKLATMLTLPEEIVRLYRDDITITVIFFNTDHIASLE
uniref:PPM-type phosphatase domain-containing protein n=1 Tax=Branchiostoma floridae TaxID=7739 RepID=C3XUB5_BRAFL|eukprot:XP_002612480.1 hypothetical protein BRAFLDRAFT_278942 [Branchiostoma floridae]